MAKEEEGVPFQPSHCHHHDLSVPSWLPPRSYHIFDVLVGSHPLPIAPSSYMLLSYAAHPILTLAMFLSRIQQRRSNHALSGISGAPSSLEHYSHKSLQSDLSISTMPLPLYATRLCLLLLFCLVDPRYVKDCTAGKLTDSVILTGSLSPVVCRCSVFTLLTVHSFPSL